MAPGDLQEVLLALEGRDGVAPETARDLLVGLGRADDAAVFRITDDVAIVETVDFFPPVVDDPYTWGAVAAANAMSDVYAMGGEVLFALAVAGFPRELDRTVIAEVFRGGADKVREAGGVIAGGHTVVDAEPKYGLCVTGRVHPDRILIKGGLRPGDRLFLSKPLGTGVITTAAKAAVAGDEALTAAVTSMLRLNRAAALVALAHGARGATDITGFGLLGHALEMVTASGADRRQASHASTVASATSPVSRTAAAHPRSSSWRSAAKASSRTHGLFPRCTAYPCRAKASASCWVAAGPAAGPNPLSVCWCRLKAARMAPGLAL